MTRAEVAVAWGILLAGFFAAWSVLAATLPVPAYVLPPPAAVVDAFGELTLKEPVAVYAASSDKVLAGHGTRDATCGVFTMDNGAVWSMNISWALPVTWPGAVYGLEIGIVGTRGVIDIEDTHRDLVLASDLPQAGGYRPEGFEPGAARHVDFLTSYPPGDLYDGQLWGPMREETNAWLARLYAGLKTPHATAADGHRNLVLTMAMDLSARRGEVIKLPVELDELGA